MSAKPRAHRWPWLLGILLLVASAIGAGVVLNQNSDPGGAAKDDKSATPPVIMCIGFVDVEPGVANLFPVQTGRVEKVAHEGPVKKGDPLLVLESKLPKLKLDEAQAALTAAKSLWQQAKKLPIQHKLQVAQQMSAILAAKHMKMAAVYDLQLKEKYFKEDLISFAQKEMAAEMVKKLGAAVDAEEAKLKELELKDPFVELIRAEADVNAKESLKEQAKMALDECTLFAPCNGRVLRVNVSVGELPNPKIPPIQFCPDGDRIVRAELIQEWASRVKPGQKVIIEDDAAGGAHWEGEVERMSDWYAQKRRILVEPFMMNDVRTLECLVRITSRNHDLRIDQRVRVRIKTAP